MMKGSRPIAQVLDIETSCSDGALGHKWAKKTISIYLYISYYNELGIVVCFCFTSLIC
jgi:hypothetical protein